MSDTQVPILTQPPEDTTAKVTEVMTELAHQTEFLTKTLELNTKVALRHEKRRLDERDKDKKLDKTIKSEIKDNSKEKEDNTIRSESKGFSIKDSVQSISTAGVNSMKLAQETFLGDISFATEPIKKMGGILGNIGGFFGLKKKKVAPKRSAMLKTNPEAVYTVDSLTKLLEGDDSMLDKFKGILPYLMGAGGITALAKKFGPMIMKAGGVAMIAGSLIWMAIDGFKAYAKAGEWGTSKLSAVIGGVLGGTDKGWKGAFKGMGKWALMGAGIGMLVGPIGALVGGLIGAAVGGIFGFIGGENLAKGFDKIGKWFKNVFWGGIKKAAVSIGTWFKELPDMLVTGFKEGWAQLKNELAGVSSFVNKIGTVINDIMEGIWVSIKEVFSKIATGIKTFIEDPIAFGKTLLGDVITKVKSIFTSIKQGFTDLINDPKQFVTDLLQPIKDFFSKIKSIFDGFLGIFETPEIDEEYMSNAIENTTKKYGNIPGITGVPIVSPIPHNDVIMRPDGSVHETSIDDTIIATKNPIAFADKESSSAMNDINKSGPSVMANLESLIKELIKKQQTQAPSNMMQQNITSRYNPQAIMANLTTEVF